MTTEKTKKREKKLLRKEASTQVTGQEVKGKYKERKRERVGEIRKNLLKLIVGRSGGRGSCSQEVIHERGINIKKIKNKEEK